MYYNRTISDDFSNPEEPEMYYNRTISDDFSKLLGPRGNLRWLVELVRKYDHLDFLIGKNNSKEWISIYRGLSRVLTIKNFKNKPGKIKLDGAEAYKKILPDLYGEKDISVNFSKGLLKLVHIVSRTKKFDRYYNNKKEGYFQNELSRKFGICGKSSDDFVIIDKEAVVGYKNKEKKEKIYGKIRDGYKKLQKDLSSKDPKRFGSHLEKKAIGNELDFLALDKQGNILLIEYKHGTGNTSGIYLSPLQIGMYFELFSELPKVELEKSILEMLEQKKRIGLINSKWKTPKIKGIIPILIISKYNRDSSAKKKYQEVMNFARARKGPSFLEKIKTYNYTNKGGLKPW